MNSSSYNNGSTVLRYRDSYSTAVARNVIVLALGISINYFNATLVHTFRKHQILYVNPRYMLFIHLVVNDMIQLTTSVGLFVFSYIFYKINSSLCCIMIVLAVLTTLNTPFNLAVMAVECYIAVCLPLRHSEFCTIKRTLIVFGLIWAMSAATILPDVFFLLATEPVQFFYSTVLCNRDGLFRHPILLKKMDVCNIIFLIGVWLTLFYTYIKIFLTAKTADGDAKKARKTILLHGFQLLLCMLTFVYPLITQAVLYLFPKHFVNIFFVSYIFIQILPRFLSPIVYGLRDNTFRQHLKKSVLCTVRVSAKPWSNTAAKSVLLYHLTN